MAAAFIWVGSDPSKGRVTAGALGGAFVAVLIVLLVKRWLPTDSDSSPMAGFGSALILGVVTIFMGRYYRVGR